MSTQEALQQLEEQVRAINDAQREQAQHGIMGEPFTIFWLLKQEGAGAPEAEAVARRMAKMLDGATVSNVPQAVERILRTLRGERR